jgi:Ni,Fe-hydrogenase III large subunit
MSARPLAIVRNGQPLPLDEVPLVAFDELRELLVHVADRDERVATFAGIARHGVEVELLAVIADDTDGVLRLARTRVAAEYASMTRECPELHLFEREIAETWGVTPERHPWPKPVRFPRGEVGVMDFFRVHGEEIHEVAVGPVHAGVIEPGHFRFQCHGEIVFHLEIALGYQHRGIERALVGGPSKRTVYEIETIAGDTSIGHATAYAEIVESLSGVRAPARAIALRGIALELERLANHTGNLGALAGDVGFLPTASFCGRLRGDFLNLTAEIAGSRFGRGLVRPGGVAFDVDAERVARMRARLDAASRDVEEALALLAGSPSVQARFEDTGRVSAEDALAIGLVGVAARGCAIERDVRHDFPSGVYRFAQIPMSLWHSGDVFARAQVREREVVRSAAFVREQLAALPGGPVRAEGGHALAPRSICVALVEGWRGEICHVAITGDDGRFAAYKIVDPSFHNWTGLALALRDQQISDFPLCNKSFDLSYCGHDL